MQFDPLELSNHYNFEISKIQDGGGHHLEKSKNRHTLAFVGPIYMKFCTLMQFDPFDPSDH